MQIKDYGEHYEEDAFGVKYWYLHGRWHRKDAPAIISPSGAKYWCRHGKLHREDGPANTYSDGSYGVWYLNGERLTQKEWEARVKCI